MTRSNGGESNFMAERQSSPGEVTARSEPDMTQNGPAGAGAHGGTQAPPGVAAPADDARAEDTTSGARLTPGATEAFTLYDTPEGICEKLDALRKAGVAYILLTTLGGTPQLRRFARDIIPAFASESLTASGEPSFA